MDDVSIMEDNNPIAASSIIMSNQTEYCVDDPVVIDGSASQNVQEYAWEIHQSGNPIYVEGVQTGSPGTFDFINALNSIGLTPNKGECYDIILNTFAECSDNSSLTICFQDPTIDIIFDELPICEGAPFNIQVTGDNDWTYTWSTGDNGVGEQMITTIADPSTTSYSVTVTTDIGCTYTADLTNIVVHTNMNVPPGTTGINGTGTFTHTVNADGGSFCFDIPTFDSPNEVTTINWDNSLSQFTYSVLGSPNQTGEFCWLSPGPLENEIGEYCFDIFIEDNNACEVPSIPVVKEVCIRVICDHCPICKYYDNRTPGNNPLPPETKVGSCIEAGLNGPVNTGTANVLFEAGESIVLHPNNFVAGPGFTAQIDPNICITDCEDCCDNWNGFTLDLPIPNVFTPNGDGVNDLWRIMDLDHPQCAYGATEFELEIRNRWGDLVYQLNESDPASDGLTCCPFVSPSYLTENVTPSISWNGVINSGLGSGQMVSDGTYFYTLSLTGCGNSANYSGQFLVAGTGANLAPFDEPPTFNYPTNENVLQNSNPGEPNSTAEDSLDMNQQMLSVYPNPASSILQVKLHDRCEPGDWLYIIDSNGKTVWTNPFAINPMIIDVLNLASGSYTVIVTSGQEKLYKHIVIKL